MGLDSGIKGLSRGFGLSAGGAAVPIPVNTVAPVVSGTVTVGSVLSCTTGTWTNPGSFTYQWRKNGTNIAGATTNSYTLLAGDVGGFIDCRVTSSPTSAISNTVGPVA